MNPLRNRQAVAATAARIMAEQGVESFLAAKQKAADQLGLGRQTRLPGNEEVAAALRGHLALFGGRPWREALDRRFAAALETMELLQDFAPRLAGPLAEGLAHQHSPVVLHVFSDDPDAPLRLLLDRRIPYRLAERRGGQRGGRQPLIVLRGNDIRDDIRGDIRIELWVYARHDLRLAPPSPIDGRPQVRLTVAETVAARERSGLSAAQQ